MDEMDEFEDAQPRDDPPRSEEDARMGAEPLPGDFTSDEGIEPPVPQRYTMHTPPPHRQATPPRGAYDHTPNVARSRSQQGGSPPPHATSPLASAPRFTIRGPHARDQPAASASVITLQDLFAAITTSRNQTRADIASAHEKLDAMATLQSAQGESIRCLSDRAGSLEQKTDALAASTETLSARATALEARPTHRQQGRRLRRPAQLDPGLPTPSRLTGPSSAWAPTLQSRSRLSDRRSPRLSSEQVCGPPTSTFEAPPLAKGSSSNAQRRRRATKGRRWTSSWTPADAAEDRVDAHEGSARYTHARRVPLVRRRQGRQRSCPRVARSGCGTVLRRAQRHGDRVEEQRRQGVWVDIDKLQETFDGLVKRPAGQTHW